MLKLTKKKLHDIIFYTESPAAKWFDIVLIWTISLSVLIIMLDSVGSIKYQYGELLNYFEWFFTILFSIEFLFRVYLSKRKLDYVLSFFGIIDLLSVLPTYIAVLYPGIEYLVIIRLLRVLRIFRILKLVKFVGESKILINALIGSQRKILVFIFAVLIIATVIGSVMYVVEGPENGFTSIPISIYWTIVTLTTVGYGDISPLTSLGKFIATVLMILGYGVIAVPTGIAIVGISNATKEIKDSISCKTCGNPNNNENAKYCSECGDQF
jgi:voltage-gated potassium channel